MMQGTQLSPDDSQPLRRKGMREQLVVAERANDQPYDFERLEIVEEPWVEGDEPPRPSERRLPMASR